LQGIATLNDGKTFFDFRPGMKLKEIETVFMPQYEGAEDKMIMASHVERMKKSKCYINSGKLSCITCHNPHVSVKFTPETQFLNACQSCHSGAKQLHCSEQENVRLAQNNNCITCHMPKNGSIDIPHVAVTDHYIRKRPEDDNATSKIKAFLGLHSFNNDHPDAITIGRGYMSFFEKFNDNKGLLDSAFSYLNKEAKREQTDKQNRDWIRFNFLKNNFGQVVQYAAALQPEMINDAWATYRVAEAYEQLQQLQEALKWYKRTVALQPYSLDFQNKYASCLLMTNHIDEAAKVLTFILNENPLYINANINLGYLYSLQGNNAMAYSYMIKAQELDPDAAQNLINLAVWYHNNQQQELAKKTLLHLLQKHPENEQAKAMLADLNAS
jgi:tetratricopeptide (TPR) repeat protein